MCVCENNVALPHFWEVKGGLFYNTLTHSSVRERPQRVRGGILADDMGLVRRTHTHRLLTMYSTQTHTPFTITTVVCVFRGKR